MKFLSNGKRFDEGTYYGRIRVIGEFRPMAKAAQGSPAAGLAQPIIIGAVRAFGYLE